MVVEIAVQRVVAVEADVVWPDGLAGGDGKLSRAAVVSPAVVGVIQGEGSDGVIASKVQDEVAGGGADLRQPITGRGIGSLIGLASNTRAGVSQAS